MTKNLDKDGFCSIVDDYQLFYIDLWGVIHNGINLHKEAVNVLKEITKKGKEYILLTNAPRPNDVVKSFLEKMGMEKKLRDHVFTSGQAALYYLKKKYSINVHDKARGVGGRSSFKRYKGKIGFDHGLQYLSPRSKEFKSFTNKLIKKKVLKHWAGNHEFLNKKVKKDKKHIKLIGVKGNNDISKFLLKNINCNFESELKKIKRKNIKLLQLIMELKKIF